MESFEIKKLGFIFLIVWVFITSCKIGQEYSKNKRVNKKFIYKSLKSNLNIFEDEGFIKFSLNNQTFKKTKIGRFVFKSPLNFISEYYIKKKGRILLIGIGSGELANYLITKNYKVDIFEQNKILINYVKNRMNFKNKIFQGDGVSSLIKHDYYDAIIIQPYISIIYKNKYYTKFTYSKMLYSLRYNGKLIFGKIKYFQKKWWRKRDLEYLDKNDFLDCDKLLKDKFGRSQNCVFEKKIKIPINNKIGFEYEIFSSKCDCFGFETCYLKKKLNNPIPFLGDCINDDYAAAYKLINYNDTTNDITIIGTLVKEKDKFKIHIKSNDEDGGVEFYLIGDMVNKIKEFYYMNHKIYQELKRSYSFFNCATKGVTKSNKLGVAIKGKIVKSINSFPIKKFIFQANIITSTITLQKWNLFKNRIANPIIKKINKLKLPRNKKKIKNLLKEIVINSNKQFGDLLSKHIVQLQDVIFYYEKLIANKSLLELYNKIYNKKFKDDKICSFLLDRENENCSVHIYQLD
jgi:hypothetical protein